MAADPGDPQLPARAAAESQPKQGELFTASDLFELERTRIASYDRRTDVARAAIEAERESERQLYDYHMARLASHDAQNKRQHSFASRFLWAWLGIGVVFVGLLLFMAFFGTAHQNDTSLKMLSTLGKLASGAGIFVLIRQVWRYLFRRNTDE